MNGLRVKARLKSIRNISNMRDKPGYRMVEELLSDIVVLSHGNIVMCHMVIRSHVTCNMIICLMVTYQQNYKKFNSLKTRLFVLVLKIYEINPRTYYNESRSENLEK